MSHLSKSTSFIFKGIWGYGRFMKTIYSLNTQDKNEVVKYRLRIIAFFNEFGLQATIKAFNVRRATIYLWKKKLKDKQGNPCALIPVSTRPKGVRRMIVNRKVYDFIRNIRENNYRLGKEKIKILLDPYCCEERLTKVSVSWIGKLIKRENLSFNNLRIYHNPSHKWKDRKRTVKERVKKGFKSKYQGELLQIDTIVKFDLGLKRYILTAIDLYSRFSFAFSYKTLSSRMALDFMRKLELVSPFKVKGVKTDNGLEFLGEFDNYLKDKGITHYFSYPRTPESNAFIERFNRTIQEEFVNDNLEYLEDTQIFNSKLMDYLLYYNTVRPHQTLNYLTPMAFMLKQGLKSNMYGTDTSTCNKMPFYCLIN